MTLEELQRALDAKTKELDEEKSRTLALQKQIDDANEKIKGIEKENSDFKLENTRLRTTNGELLLKLDDTRVKEDSNDDKPLKTLEESMLDILKEEK